MVLRPTERERKRRKRKRCSCRGEEANVLCDGCYVYAFSRRVCEREGRQNKGNVGNLKISLKWYYSSVFLQEKLFF